MFGERHMVSDQGDVWRLEFVGKDKKTRPARMVAIVTQPSGYRYARIGSRNYFVHRLVGHCFLARRDDQDQVNHLNGIRGDNRAANLEWCTVSENHLHSFRVLGRSNKGLRNRFPPTCRPVIGRKVDGAEVHTFRSIAEAARKTGGRKSSIGNVCAGRKKKTNGWFFEYAGVTE